MKFRWCLKEFIKQKRCFITQLIGDIIPWIKSVIDVFDFALIENVFRLSARQLRVKNRQISENIIINLKMLSSPEFKI